MSQLDHLRMMRHSPVMNYAGIPGLTSWLIGEASLESGCVRLFECQRQHQEALVPHSHRFDLHCVVLEGAVTNRLWYEEAPHPLSDPFIVSTLTYDSMGVYAQTFNRSSNWRTLDTVYRSGDEYSMKAEQVHSIYFARNTTVLFFEGPTTTDESIILEPCVDGERVPTFKVEPWMFKK